MDLTKYYRAPIGVSEECTTPCLATRLPVRSRSDGLQDARGVAIGRRGAPSTPGVAAPSPCGFYGSAGGVLFVAASQRRMAKAPEAVPSAGAGRLNAVGSGLGGTRVRRVGAAAVSVGGPRLGAVPRPMAIRGSSANATRVPPSCRRDLLLGVIMALARGGVRMARSATAPQSGRVSAASPTCRPHLGFRGFASRGRTVPITPRLAVAGRVRARRGFMPIIVPRTRSLRRVISSTSVPALTRIVRVEVREGPIIAVRLGVPSSITVRGASAPQIADVSSHSALVEGAHGKGLAPITGHGTRGVARVSRA